MRLQWNRARCVLIALVMATGAAAAAAPDIPNFQKVGPQAYAAGQPPASAFDALSARGVRHVINLRPMAEGPDFNEAAAATAAGMAYYNIPIAGADDLDRANVERLDAVLARTGDQGFLLHCASSNRVGALMALRSAWLEDAPASEALAKGRRWGLSSLESVVRERLQANE